MHLVAQAGGDRIEADAAVAGREAAQAARAAAGPAVVAVVGHAGARVQAERVVVVRKDVGLGVAGGRQCRLIAGAAAGLQAAQAAGDVDEAAYAGLVAVVLDHRQRHRRTQRMRHQVHLALAGIGLDLVDEGLDDLVGGR
ncbi:hypothetical protein D3C71_1659000 [compost metagenome]